MEDAKELRKRLAEQMIALLYNDGEQPSDDFLSDLKQMVNGSITEDEMRARIILRHNGKGE